METQIPTQTMNLAFRFRMMEKRIELLEKQLSRDFNKDARAALINERQAKVKQVVAKKFALGADSLVLKTNSRSIVYPRQIAMYLMYTAEGMSYPEVAYCFGGRHHTTVLHSVKKIHNQRQFDRKLDCLLIDLQGRLTA